MRGESAEAIETKNFFAEIFIYDPLNVFAKTMGAINIRITRQEQKEPIIRNVKKNF